jgi:hypothetical protein
MSAKLVEITQRMPGRVLSGRAAAEIVARHQDLRIPIGGPFEDEVRVLGAVLVQAHLGEEAFLQARALDRLQILLRDDHVGVDIHDRQRGGDAGKGGEGLHGAIGSGFRTGS